MVSVLQIQSLGVPVLVDERGETIQAKTRKALAILVYLLRVPGNSIPREALADVFWSDAPREKATQSLRQALRQLRAVEEQSGVSFLVTRNVNVSINTEFLDWDVARLDGLVKRGTAADFLAAQSLWRGDFLYGFETLDAEFNSWLIVERERIRSSLISSVLEQIDILNVPDDADRIETAAVFLLLLDRSMEHAHQVLIRLFLSRGQKERAAQQLKACERELKACLDANPDPETYALFETSKQSHPPAVIQQLGELGRAGGLPLDDDGGIRLPVISIVSSSATANGDESTKILRDEIVAGLSSYRAFDLFEAEYQGNETLSNVTRLDGGELGSYLLRFRRDGVGKKAYIQFEDRDTGRIVFNEIADFNLTERASSPREVAYQTVSRIHSHAIGRLRRSSAISPFARWCQAEALLWEFSPASDAKAARLFEGLASSHSSFSMTYAGQASINMKQLLYYPSADNAPDHRVEDILQLVEKAVMLDPWQSFNQRINGWALIQSGLAEDANRAFSHARKLSPSDPNNLMSVAEGFAFVGDIDQSLQVAEDAFSLYPTVPRIFYEYLANIHFAAENFSSAVECMERAPTGSIFGLTTRVAALTCIGRDADAIHVLRTFGDRFENLLDRESFLQPDKMSWYRRINFFQDPTTQQNYRKGAELVRRFLGGEI